MKMLGAVKINLSQYSSQLTKHFISSGETGTDFNSFFTHQLFRFFKSSCNLYHASGLFLCPQKTSKDQIFCDLLKETKGFLMFSGAMKRDQWHEMV